MTTSNYSKEAVAKDIRRVAKTLGHAPTRREYRKKGNFSSWLTEARFGSWTKALKKANV